MFENIIGNEPIKKMLEQAITNNKISHSYMFLGISGIGKKIIAREFAIKILEVEDTENIPDLLYIEPDGNSIKIEQIREMQKKVQEKPIGAKRKVYIIDQADKMTSEAQNCLLKTLEEPPEYVTIILISSNENIILNTIKSRCMSIKFKNITEENLTKFAKEILGYQNLTENLLKSFGGSIGKCIKLKENSDQYIKIENFVNDLSKKDIIDIMVNAKIIYDKENINDILDYLIVCLYNIAKEKREYLDCIKHVNECSTRLKANANFDMSIDRLVLKMWEEVK